MVDLRRMRLLIKKLPKIEWDVEKKMANATRITTSITGMPRGGDGANRQEEANIALADAREAYRETLEELEQMRAELTPMIDSLEDINEKGTMRMRYIKGHRIDEIAETIDRDIRSVYRYLTSAEEKICEMQNSCHCMSK